MSLPHFRQVVCLSHGLIVGRISRVFPAGVEPERNQRQLDRSGRACHPPPRYGADDPSPLGDRVPLLLAEDDADAELVDALHDALDVAMPAASNGKM